jgi:CheY-like chemotaxis protein
MKYANPASIFIIDDSITDCHFMVTRLSQAGYRVAFSTDGQEGLANIVQRPPHCLIINVILSGLSGYAVCRHVRTIHALDTIPIIALSTKNTSLDQNYSFKMGANHYLPKPFTEHALLQAVQKMLPDFSPTSLKTPVLPPLTSQPIPPKPVIPLTVSMLIPYRQDEIDIMLQNNPFARASAMKDGQVRRLYALIDGKKTIKDLAEMSQLDMQATLKILKTLWQQQQIAFYDTKRRPFKDTSIFDNII